MANIPIQKINDPTTAKPLPLFAEIEKRLGEIQRRAFELFERRGCELGHALEDWLAAEHQVMGWPAAELVEKQGKYDLGLTVPGFDPKDVEVTVTPSEIIVHARAQPEKKAEDAKVVWTEFGPNDVYRRFVLPEPIDVDKTNATLDRGMLHVLAEKKPQPQAKPIAVQAA